MANGGVDDYIDNGNDDDDDDDEIKMAKQESPEKAREKKTHFVKSPHRQCVVVFGNCCSSLSGSKDDTKQVFQNNIFVASHRFCFDRRWSEVQRKRERDR